MRRAGKVGVPPPCKWGSPRTRSRYIFWLTEAPTLISSYHSITNFSSKYICEELDGTLRDGIHKMPRFLTPRECCRMMGFPESFITPDPVCSGAHSVEWFYHQIGNAVCPPVIQSIGENIVAILVGSTPPGRDSKKSVVFGEGEQ